MTDLTSRVSYTANWFSQETVPSHRRTNDRQSIGSRNCTKSHEDYQPEIISINDDVVQHLDCPDCAELALHTNKSTKLLIRMARPVIYVYRVFKHAQQLPPVLRKCFLHRRLKAHMITLKSGEI